MKRSFTMTRTSRFTPFWRRIGFQLGTLTVVCLAVSLIVYGVFTVQQQTDLAEASLKHEGRILANNIANAAAHYMLASDLASLEHLALSSATLPEIAMIQVLDPQGWIISEAVHESGEIPRPVFKPRTLAPPAEPQPQSIPEQDAFVFWHPINAIRHLGWVRLEYRADHITDLTNLVWKNTGFAILAAGGFSVLLLLLFLRPYVKAISAASTFAADLDRLSGQDFQPWQRTAELNQLGTALGHVSQKLYEQDARRTRMEHELRDSRRAYQTLTDNIPGIIYRRSIQGDLEPQLLNNMFAPITGYRFEDLDDPQHGFIYSLVHPEDRAEIDAVLQRALETGQPFETEYRLRHKDGDTRFLLERGVIVRSEDQEAPFIDGIILDITERRHAEAALYAEKERAQVTLHSIGDAVISTDTAGTVEYLNPMAEKLTGWKLEEAQGKPIDKVFHIINEETRKLAPNPVARCLREGIVIGLANHTVLVSRTGPECAIQDSAAPIRGRDGEIMGVVLVFSDVTEARRMSHEITHQASHDALTGLINRFEFDRRLRRVLDTTRITSTRNALCFLDLDQFKLVNDTSGHIAGDELLRQISMLLQENVRQRDTIARLGGDEFGLLMEHCSLEEAAIVARKLTSVLEEFTFSWEEKRFNVGVSIGLVAVDEFSADSQSLLSAADSACYIAKKHGRNQVHIYQHDDEELAERHGEMLWAVQIPKALKENRFRLFAQPIVSLASGQETNTHYEVLLRMAGEDGELILPGTFLPAADRYSLSGKLDRCVIRKMFEWLVAHPQHVERLHVCAINLSGHSLNDETFLGFVRDQFYTSPIPPDKICFEITETVAITNLSRATSFVKALHSQGCLFALDDFGSGLSSFAYLKHLPVDMLKIDGLFVKDIARDPTDFAMVKSINEIGKVMGKKTIAEFVESEDILEKLRTIEVDYVQGYGVGLPRPIEELLLDG